MIDPAATGKGVRVAVIDSGVFPGHPHIDAARLTGGVSITREGDVDDDPASMIDRLGHGTAVTAAIQERVPDADIVTVRVFREALRASPRALISAIDWSVDAGVDIVNMSLGSTNDAHEEAFARAAERAAQAGVLLVAARAVDEAPCWPGALPSVVGVALDWDCPRGDYRLIGDGGASAFAAAGYPRPIEGVPPRRNLQGISFAVAQMTGFAAQACERLRAVQSGADIVSEVPNMLREQARRAVET